MCLCLNEDVLLYTSSYPSYGNEGKLENEAWLYEIIFKYRISTPPNEAVAYAMCSPNLEDVQRHIKIYFEELGYKHLRFLIWEAEAKVMNALLAQHFPQYDIKAIGGDVFDTISDENMHHIHIDPSGPLTRKGVALLHHLARRNIETIILHFSPRGWRTNKKLRSLFSKMKIRLGLVGRFKIRQLLQFYLLERWAPKYIIQERGYGEGRKGGKGSRGGGTMQCVIMQRRPK